MRPEQLLHHHDHASLWPPFPGLDVPGLDVPGAYQRALAVRQLRMARGEQPRGFKIGFTNRSIWPRYNVDAPIWGTVWNTSLTFCDGEGRVSLAGICQPRLEPEAVFGMAAKPPLDASLDQLLACIDWVAPGFEIVQSHQLDWKFSVPDTVADGALHARLLVGTRVPVAQIAPDAQAFEQRLVAARVALSRGNQAMEQGAGANVLDGPLHALWYFLRELRACPGAPDLQPGDVVTTGTWTDAWPVAASEQWMAVFDAPLSALTIGFD
jgi:2-oxo-3-hexenedioate decarboxylase